MNLRMPAILTVAILSSLPHVHAQAAGIYVCVDARGNKITSDRPIPACNDREQRQLSNSGVTQRVVPPSYTAAETAAQKERDQKAEEERKKVAAEKKAQAVLLQRYPTPASHQAARLKAADEIQQRLRESFARLNNLKAEQQKLAQEMEFYKKSPDSAPGKLRGQWQTNQESQQSTQTSIEKQRQELVELHKRFDAELAGLQVLWKGN